MPNGHPDLNQVKLAILGAGQMGEAILRGGLLAGIEPVHIKFTTLDDAAAAHLIATWQVVRAPSNLAAVIGADLVVVAVKPQDVAPVLLQITPDLAATTVVVSVAVGVALEQLATSLPVGQPIVRAMPNTPVAVGQGVTALSSNQQVTTPQLSLVERVFRGAGRVVIVPENSQPAIGAIAGSGPAYVAYFIEALIEAGVHQGLSRPLATDLALATFVGTAAMLEQTGEHPTIARERVTSPGGTTAAALAELDNAGVRAAIGRAVAAAVAKTHAISGT
jgi:pyrroline-5-carboxylate reductase